MSGDPLWAPWCLTKPPCLHLIFLSFYLGCAVQGTCTEGIGGAGIKGPTQFPYTGVRQRHTGFSAVLRGMREVQCRANWTLFLVFCVLKKCDSNLWHSIARSPCCLQGHGIMCMTAIQPHMHPSGLITKAITAVLNAAIADAIQG